MLRICSAAARGLWVECMCLMHEAKPYGHLLVNGRPVTDTQIANLTGIPQDQISSLLAELENAGVFSRNSDGVIYSRRMTRDAKRAADGERYGKRGGNPALTDKPTLNPTLNPQDNGGGSPRSQRPEPERKNPKDVIHSFSKGLGRTEQDWTPEQKKQAWQSRICVEAQRTMPEAEFKSWMIAWANGEPHARKVAEQIDSTIREARARA